MQILARTQVFLALSGLGAEAETRAHVAAAVEQAEAIGDPTFLASTFWCGGLALAMLGHADEALAHYETALRYADAAGASIAGPVMSSLAIELDDAERATALLRVAIPMARHQQGGHFHTYPMVAAAKVASRHGRPREAAQLLGAVGRCYEHAGINGERYWLLLRDRLVEQLTAILGAAAVAQEQEAGHRLSADEGLKLALECIAP